MSRWTRIGLVIGGYLLACLGAGFSVYLRVLFTQAPAAQASSGMYAFGDLLLFLGVFGILMLVPTGLGVFFLIRSFKNR